MINPIFFAYQKAMLRVAMDTFMGITYDPDTKKHKDPNSGAAFAKGHGIQQEENGAEKEAKVRVHLDKLADESKARYLAQMEKYPEVYEHEYPRSDLIELRDEAEKAEDIHQAERDVKEYLRSVAK